MKKIKSFKQFESFSSEASYMINEDNLEMKSIAKDLYTYLKKIGVAKVHLSAGSGKNYKRIGQRPGGMSTGESQDNTAQIQYWDDPYTKQTLVQVHLNGNNKKTKEIKDKLLQVYPKLEVKHEESRDGYLFFILKEKTTKKGGEMPASKSVNNGR
jgi:hypothetical protein